MPPLRAAVAGLIAQVAVLVPFAPSPSGWLAGLACGTVVCVALAVGAHRSGVTRLGPANLVTLARSALTGGVTALAVDARPALLVASVAAVALATDFVDGQVARRTGTSSSLGARFDMEVDAFLLLVLSGYVAMSVGWWVLAIGAWRYLYIGAGRLVPWLRRPVPDSTARKAVAAAQGVVLAVAASGLLPRPAAVTLAAAPLAVLTVSVARDIRWQYGNR